MRVSSSGRTDQTKSPACAGLCMSARPTALLLEAETGELLLEAGQTAAAIEQLLLAAGPGRMRLGVDIEVQHIALFAPGGARGELGAVGHFDRDGVIVGMGV